MGSSQAVDHSVLPDTAWLQWELVTPQLRWAPLLGLGSVCSHLLVPGLEGKTEIVLLDPSQSQ